MNKKRIFGVGWAFLLGFSLLCIITQRMQGAVIDLDAAPGLRPPETVSWVRLYGESVSKIVRIGPDDMIYVLGTTERGSESYFRQLENKPDLTIPEGEDDLFLAKYDRSGRCLWFKTFGVEGASDGYEEFVIDPFGNLLIRVVLGWRGKFQIDGNPIDSEISGSRGIWRGIVRFDLDGEFQESYSQENLILFGPNGESYSVRKHKPDGLNTVTDISKSNGAGDLEWTRQFRQSGGMSSFYRSVQIGSDGKIYTAEGTVGFYAHLENDHVFVQRTGLLVAQYSSEGWLDWYKVFDSEKPADRAHLRLDADNNITVAGGFFSALDLGDGTFLEPEPNELSQSFLLRLDSGGNLRWGHKIKSSRWSTITGLSLDSVGGAYFMGLRILPDESFALGFSPQGELVFSANTGVNYGSSIAAFGPNEIYLSGGLATPERWPSGLSSVPIVVGNWEVPSRIVGRDQSYLIRIGEMPLGVISHPVDVELERDWSGAQFQVLTIGSDKIRYQWRKNGISLVEDEWHQGVGTSTLIVRGRRQHDEGLYDVVVTTDRESLTSEAAELSFTNLPPEFADPNGIVLEYNRSSGPFEEVFEIEIADPDGDTRFDWNLVFGLATDEVSLASSSTASNQLLIKISGLEKNGITARGFVEVTDQDGALLKIPVKVTFYAGEPTIFRSSRSEPGQEIAFNLRMSEDTATQSERLVVEDLNLNPGFRNPEVLTWRIAEKPSFGNLSLGTQTPTGSRYQRPYEYTPDPNFNGIDSFVIEVTGNESEGWAKAEVTVTVDPLNDAPEVALPLRLGVSSAEVGQVISPKMQDWTDLETDLRSIPFRYQWFLSSSAVGEGPVPLEGETSPSLHIQRGWEGQFLGVRVTAIDGNVISHVPEGHTLDEGGRRAIFVFSEFIPVVGVALPEVNLTNLPTSRLPLALNRRGVFLGGPWLLEEGRTIAADSIRNFNNPELADPRFLQGVAWGLTGQEGVVWVRDAAMPSRVDFFNFTELQDPQLKLFSSFTGVVRGDQFQRSFLTSNGDRFVNLGPTIEHLNGPASTTRSGDFLNSILEKISPDSTRAIFYESRQGEALENMFALTTFPGLEAVKNFEFGLGFYNELRKGDLVETPNQPVGWGMDPTGQRLLVQHGVSRAEFTSPLAGLPVVRGLTLLDLETGEVLGQRAMDFERDRILFSWRDPLQTSHPLTVTLNQNGIAVSCFILARSFEDTDAALLEYRDWSSGDLVRSVAVEDGIFHHGDFYRDSAIDPDREFWMYPSVVEPSLLLLDLATGEIVHRIEPFLNDSVRGIAEVAVSQDQQLITWLESTNPIDPVIPRVSGVTLGFTAFHPRANGDVHGLVFDDLNENGRLDLSLIQSDEPHIVYVIDVSGSALDEFEGSEVGDVNSDSDSNTILDAEIAAFQDFHRNLLAFGLGASTKVAVVAFAEEAVLYDQSGLVTGGVRLIGADSDENGNQIPDVIEALSLVRQGIGNVGSGTNFRAALQAARDVFAQSGSTPEQANVLFLSDGAANENNYTTLADDLRSIGINLRAIGVGEGSSLTGLRRIDPSALKVFSTDELIAVFQPEEEPLAGLEVYADLNANGQHDPDEPTALTASDNPFTASNEAGVYHIAGLSPGPIQIRLMDEAIRLLSAVEVEVKPVVRSRHLIAVRLGEAPTIEAPIVTVQPLGVSVSAGEPAVFEVSVSGAGVLTFQWEIDGQAIAGAILNRYEIPSASLEATGDYRVRVSNEGGSVFSDVARLSVSSVVANGPAGTNPLAWFKTDSGLSTMGASVVAWTDETQSGIRLTPGGNGPVIVPDALNGNAAIAFDGNTQLGGALESGFLSEATIFALFRYTVPESDNDYLYTLGLPGAKGSQLSLSRLTGGFAYHYDGEAQFLDGSIPSNEWLVASQTYGGGGGVQHNLFLDSELVLASTTESAYRVDSSHLTLGNWSSGEFRFVGELAEFLVYDHVLEESDRMAVESYLRDRIGIEIPVDPPIAPPFILVGPMGVNVMEGEDVELLVAAQGLGELSYEWLLDGDPIPDETETRLHLTGVSSEDGGSYQVRVSNAGGSVLSEPAEVTVESLPVETTACPGDGGLVLFLNATGPVLDLDGFFAGEDVFGQLYVGASESELEPLCEPISSIGSGVFSGGEISVPGFDGGATVSVQVRAWKGAETYELATIRGRSDIRTVRLKTVGDLVPAPSAGTLAFQLQSVPQEAAFAPIVRNGDSLTLRWTGPGKLQEASVLIGPYRDSDDQGNPQTIDPKQSERLFFRIIAD